MRKRSHELKDLPKSGDAKMKKELVALQLFKEVLLSGKNARTVAVDEEERNAVADLQLLTAKPVIYVANVDEGSIAYRK